MIHRNDPYYIGHIYRNSLIRLGHGKNTKILKITELDDSSEIRVSYWLKSEIVSVRSEKKTSAAALSLKILYN